MSVPDTAHCTVRFYSYRVPITLEGRLQVLWRGAVGRGLQLWQAEPAVRRRVQDEAVDRDAEVPGKRENKGIR